MYKVQAAYCKHNMAATLIRGTSGTRLCPLKLKSTFKSSGLKQFSKPQRAATSVICTSISDAKVVRLLSTSRTFRSDAVPSYATTTPAPPKGLPEATNGDQEATKEDKDVYKERYIPLTRQSLIRHLVQEKSLFTDEEQKQFPDFVHALDSALINKYHGVLQELKALFDPINPDKDTQTTRELSKKDKLDNEFLLLQQLDEVMEKANFHELPRRKVEKFLKDHEGHGVRISVDPSRYDILRFWVLGHEIPELQLSLMEKIVNRIMRRQPRKPMEYFKRVVVAVRLKKDSKLILKAFKEIPINDIEMLLPDGQIRMRPIDKTILTGSAGLAGVGVLGKTVTLLADLHMDWFLGMSLVTGFVGFRVWSTYRNRRNSYLLDVSRVLYFKNIANNRGLLTLLVDRAEDESLKEAMLTYAFILSSEIAEYRTRSTWLHVTRPSGLTEEELKEKVENWLAKKTGVRIEFDPSEALQMLRSFGLLSMKNDKYHVLYLDAASKVLPDAPHSVIARRAVEADFTEGYDRDEYLETEEEYKEEEEKTKKYGWF